MWKCEQEWEELSEVYTNDWDVVISFIVVFFSLMVTYYIALVVLIFTSLKWLNEPDLIIPSKLLTPYHTMKSTSSDRTGMKRIGFGIRRLLRSNSQTYDLSNDSSDSRNTSNKLRNRFSFRSLGSLEPVPEVTRFITTMLNKSHKNHGKVMLLM